MLSDDQSESRDSGSDESRSYNGAVGSSGVDSYNSAVGSSEAASAATTPAATPTQAPDPTTDSTPAPTPSPDPTATAAPEPTPDIVVPDSTDSSSDPSANVTNGSEVYTLSCARCHGEDGFGSIHRGLLGINANYSQATLVDELTNGHPHTFGFGDELSATEIRDVASYVLASFG